MEASVNVWSLRTFCLITGASRGFGQRMAGRFSSLLPTGSVILLIARDEKGLASTAKQCLRNDDILVDTWSVDLSSLDDSGVSQGLSDVLRRLNRTASDFEQVVLVHNAASLGDVTVPLVRQTDVGEMDRYWRLNLTSTVVLNSVFWKLFREDDVKHRLVINITSICAKQPFKSWALYCAGKAARDMLFSTMALEEPSIRVLSYAPGPIDTQMQVEARTKTADPELRTIFESLHSEKRLLSCDESLDRLIAILKENKFDSGSHIDFYDDATTD